MTNTELLPEPQLTPIVEAFLETQKDYNEALDKCGWSMSLNKSYHFEETTAAEISDNIEKLASRTDEITEALIMCVRFADFVKAGVDVLAAEYITARYRYQQQRRDIAEAPRRAWAVAYNARLAEIDKQIRGAKSRRSRTWTKYRKGQIEFTIAATIAGAIDGEIKALQERREIASAESFESVAA